MLAPGQLPRLLRNTSALGFVCLLLLSSSQPGGAAPVSTSGNAHLAHRMQEEGSWSAYFLPHMMRQLCSGDTIRLSFAVHYTPAEPQEDDDVLAPLVPPDLPPLVPLDVKTVRVYTLLGDASPAEFVVLTTYQVFSFNYTAGEAGLETIRLEIGDGLAFAEKQIQIREACDFNLSFFIIAQETVEGGVGGFMDVFSGRGEFGLERTTAASNTLTGMGRSHNWLLLWAEVEEAFTCSHEPITGVAPFSIDGSFTPPPLASMILDLTFEPMAMPSNWRWECQAVGFGEIDFDIPLGETSGNPDEHSTMKQLFFSPAGGSHVFKEDNYYGLMTVYPR